MLSVDDVAGAASLFGASAFVGSLFGGSNRNGGKKPRFVSNDGLQNNLTRQLKMSPQTLAQLHKHGVTEQMTLKLEFFFYTDTEAKGQSLAGTLKRLEYTVECAPMASDARLFLLTGWTTPIKMNETSVLGWTTRMCYVGHEHDCDFDGWGTNPRQN